VHAFNTTELRKIQNMLAAGHAGYGDSGVRFLRRSDPEVARYAPKSASYSPNPGRLTVAGLSLTSVFHMFKLRDARSTYGPAPSHSGKALGPDMSPPDWGDEPFSHWQEPPEATTTRWPASVLDYAETSHLP